jgi:UPF0716 family protein affecting phage T7 exclusion
MQQSVELRKCDNGILIVEVLGNFMGGTLITRQCFQNVHTLNKYSRNIKTPSAHLMHSAVLVVPVVMMVCEEFRSTVFTL